ncbi:MAG: hypothetical protein QME85_03500 [Candidatus Saccharicenans sp.]|nr:hypothetical protein [Candidatus Saccharicenans sp.]
MRRKTKIGKKEYIEIIGKIKLNGFYLKSSACEIDRDLFFIKKGERHFINIQDEPTMKLRDDGTVDIFHKYCLEMSSREKQPIGRIECVFCLNYSPSSCFTNEFFEEFKKANLHINTWPFFREFVFNTTARMNIPPITLPLLKARRG